MQGVAVAMPQVLGLSFDDNVCPKLDFLQQELGLSTPELREAVRPPPLPLYSMRTSTLRVTVRGHRADASSSSRGAPR